jgi:hypothetical protein
LLKRMRKMMEKRRGFLELEEGELLNYLKSSSN